MQNLLKTFIRKYTPRESTLLNDLIAYYKLDETSGDVIDETANSYDGTVTGTPSRGASGKVNEAIDLSTVGDYITLPVGWRAGGPITLAFWLEYDPAITTGDIFKTSNDGDNTNFYITNGATWVTLSISNGSNGNGSGIPLPSSGWHHFVVQIDSVTKAYKLYLDGVKKKDRVSAYDFPANYSDTIKFGGFGNGAYDCIKCWDRWLTDDEIVEDYNSGNGLELFL